MTVQFEVTVFDS